MSPPAPAPNTPAPAAQAPTADGSGRMFDQVAPRYDLLNRLMSLGLDHRWRRLLVEALQLPDEARVLDVACGTADVGLALVRRHPRVQVVGLDPSAGMLAVAADKLRQTNCQQVTLLAGDAQALPFANQAFDACTIAFGIRNVPDRLQALREMTRVTRPGGRVAVLELESPRGGLMAPLARLHVRHLVPRLGAWLSGAREYRYLERSIAAFPPAADFAQWMRQAGLIEVRVTRLAFGALHLFCGRAPPAEAA